MPIAAPADGAGDKGAHAAKGAKGAKGAAAEGEAHHQLGAAHVRVKERAVTEAAEAPSFPRVLPRLATSVVAYYYDAWLPSGACPPTTRAAPAADAAAERLTRAAAKGAKGSSRHAKGGKGGGASGRALDKGGAERWQWLDVSDARLVHEADALRDARVGGARRRALPLRARVALSRAGAALATAFSDQPPPDR